MDVGDRGVGNHLGSGGFCEIEVVLDQGVFRAVTASGHAFATVDARGSRRAFATEVWVFDFGALGKFLLCTKENAERSHAIGFAETHSIGDFLDGSIAVALEWIHLDTEHAFGLVEVRVEQLLPVSYFRPRTGFIESGWWTIESVRVNE